MTFPLNPYYGPTFAGHMLRLHGEAAADRRDFDEARRCLSLLSIMRAEDADGPLYTHAEEQALCGQHYRLRRVIQDVQEAT